MDKLGDLSDDELLVRLRGHVGKGHVWHAELIAYLVEVEDRRLDRLQACSSMWDFCTRKLGMSESEAQRRIAAARVVRRFPHVLGILSRGELHLCALYALRRHLTNDNVDELLREASGKSTRAVEAMMAARFPKPDVPSSVEPVAPQVPLQVASASGTETAWSLSVGDAREAEPRPRVEPLSATRYRVELTVSAETHAMLERIKDLMRHRNPSGDLETIVDASLGLLLAKLEKERLGKASRRRKAESTITARAASGSASTEDAPAEVSAETTAKTSSRRQAESAVTVTVTAAEDAPVEVSADTAAKTAAKSAEDERRTPARALTEHAGTTAGRRYIPQDVRRQVFARDGEQCTYRDTDGHRCPARGFLELDHIDAKALGGSETAENLRVRCRGHNALYAEQVFGRAHVERNMDLRRRKCTSSRPEPIETLARALCSLGFREPEVRRALAAVESKRDVEAAPIETLLREALRVLT